MRTLTLTEIETIYDAPKKLTKLAFESIKPSLIKGIDYKIERNQVKLSLSGCMFLADKMYGTVDAMEARRCIIELLTEAEPATPADPITIIKEQLAILEAISTNTSKASTTISKKAEENKNTELSKVKKELPKARLAAPTPNEKSVKKEEILKDEEPAYDENIEEDIRAYKEKRLRDRQKASFERQRASNNEVKQKVNDPISEAWKKEMNELVREITINRDTTFSTTIKEIYIRMRNRYGFVSEQCIKDYMYKYGLEIKPSTLSAISDDNTWKSIFKSIAEDMLEESKIA